MKQQRTINVVFRCPPSLKQKMIEASEANNKHLSEFIRSACINSLPREPLSHTKATYEAEDSGLAELVS